MPEICLRYAIWVLRRIYLRQSLVIIYNLRYAWNISEIRLRYNCDVHEICLRYVWHILFMQDGRIVIFWKMWVTEWLSEWVKTWPLESLSPLKIIYNIILQCAMLYTVADVVHLKISEMINLINLWVYLSANLSASVRTRQIITSLTDVRWRALHSHIKFFMNAATFNQV